MILHQGIGSHLTASEYLLSPHPYTTVTVAGRVVWDVALLDNPSGFVMTPAADDLRRATSRFRKLASLLSLAQPLGGVVGLP
jgi:hypothetical protein